MKNSKYNKKKIFNDPVYGFISLPFDLIFDIIEHPFFQRLRRIKQLGLTHLVYPGALHTRFHHAMGAMHLTMKALDVIQSKGYKVTKKERKATLIAILLHDIGHGPFSHALEYSIVKNVTHEDISTFFMQRLNEEFDGKLSLAIQIFENKYKKPFLHQLVSSQLDMDRLDYLKRDSFFTGVSEGVISSERIISMLNVKDGNLVIEAKGIYSIEKFIIARRLMYWQVYLHKTVLSAENLVVNILKRAKELSLKGEELFCTDALRYFLYSERNKTSFEKDPETLQRFSELDDFDITASIKVWQNHSDSILATLCKSLLNRNLYKIDIQKSPFSKEEIDRLKKNTLETTDIKEKELKYFIFTDSIKNNAYSPKKDKINLLYKDGSISDIAEAADKLNINALSEEVIKHFVCYPKQIMVNNLKKSGS
ncbi:MAG: HD domain-containing protein [Flavobacteriales bacterium]|nr:HD domain-containing protein [Flavobacteriales bacterium]